MTSRCQHDESWSKFPPSMDVLAKYILLILLTLPFAALLTDALGKTQGRMIKMAVAVTVISWLLALVGLNGQRPNVATLFVWAFLAWPVLLLVAKGYNPALSWGSIWLSVPVMSWYLVNLSMQFYYPTNGGGGGLGAGLGFFAGWFYMMIPFAVLCCIFLGGRAIVRRIRSKLTPDGKSPALHPSPSSLNLPWAGRATRLGGTTNGRKNTSR